MPGLSFYEKQHIQRLIDQEGSLKLIFDHFTRRIGKIMERWSDSGSNDVWVRNSALEKEAEKELEDLRTRLVQNINDFSIDAWSRSNQKTDDLITAFIKDFPINETIKNGLFARNNDALRAFQRRKIDNLTISDRVWKATGTAKENIEYYLGSGLSVGRTANLISQDMRQLLANPDKRFHRIRNADGKLIPSAPMKAYHPGQGVYRSSYMNAKRLAVTNTNESYRMADHDRWSRLAFVLGIEIKRSASAKGPCPICDALVGRYPKDFKYWGWHPFCICPATPILMNEDEFMNYLDDGTIPKGSSIRDIPTDARTYMEEQLTKRNVSKDSYLFKDNKKFFKNIVDQDEEYSVGDGSVKILAGIDKSASDFDSVLQVAEYFARQGSSTEITPRLHPKDVRYQEIYGDLIGTKYEGKSPDFKVDGLFYEHEGFKHTNPKRNFSNMMSRGLNQSARIVIEETGLSEHFMLKNINNRIREGQKIDEVWMLTKDGSLKLIYKKAESGK